MKQIFISVVTAKSLRKSLYILRIIVSIFFVNSMFPLHALENIVADLSIDKVSIDYRFNGIDVAIFGVARQNQNIVIMVYGPHKSFIIRRKNPVWGIWANSEGITINKAPVFYSVISSAPIKSADPAMIHSLEIGVHNINLETENSYPEEFIQNFRRVNQDTKMYQEHLGEIEFIDNTLFKAKINFPDKTPAGKYIISVFSLKGNQILNSQIMPISIENQGLNALIQKFAYQYSAFYSIMVVSSTLLIGWIANTIFKGR